MSILLNSRHTIVSTLRVGSCIAAMACLVLPGSAAAVPVVFSAAGGNPAAIQATVDGFRAQFGTLNPNVPGSFGSGRREINWDGVPDGFAAPGVLPGNFFNVNSPRGAVLSTPGTGFAVSANAGSGVAVEFGNINPSYGALFAPFSSQRLFTALGSNITGVDFFVPGSGADAATRGFGAVFTDVDVLGSTSISFFGINGEALGNFVVPATNGNGSLSFLGVFFTEAQPVVGSVRITSGTGALGPNDVGRGVDLVVMDDFIYGEPVGVAATATPAPASLPVLGAALGLLAALRRRR
jgi:hypothetical protein